MKQPWLRTQSTHGPHPAMDSIGTNRDGHWSPLFRNQALGKEHHYTHVMCIYNILYYIILYYTILYYIIYMYILSINTCILICFLISDPQTLIFFMAYLLTHILTCIIYPGIFSAKYYHISSEMPILSDIF